MAVEIVNANMHLSQKPGKWDADNFFLVIYLYQKPKLSFAGLLLSFALADTDHAKSP